MLRRNVFGLVSVTMLGILFPSTILGDSSRGVISGRVVDSSGAVLAGAQIDLQPGGSTAITNGQGEFNFSNVASGEYTLTVHYVGFAPFSQKLTVAAGQGTHLDAKLQVASKNEQIVVTAERAHGEAEAINRERESDNILQVLPVDVITSLPNTNIADAVGRLPSVTLERDEGEGKYIQIRGTESRLNNVTINGVEVPSPEGDVRQIKLDVIPANLIDSVELNKTLSANQNAGAIGGSVDLVTKTAGERPTLYLNGMGGYTPIIGGRSLDEFDGTIGQRFGANKKLGILFGASYDWNGRGIDDVEPVPTALSCGGGSCVDFQADSTVTGPFFPSYDTEDIREYRYYRTRYGFTGNVDYKLEDTSGLYVNFIYSHFNNFGDRWVWSPTVGTFATPDQSNADGTVSFNAQIRRPVQVIGSLQAGGKHEVAKWLVLYEVAASRAATEDQGYSSADFSPDANNSNNPLVGSVQYAIDPNAHTPKLIPQGGVSIFDPSLYTVSDIDFNKTYSPQLNLEGSFSVARNYTLANHFGTFEFGARVRNAHKFQDELDPVWNIDPSVAPPMSSFAGAFTNSGYYYGAYPGSFNSLQVNYGKIRAFFNANPGLFVPDVQGTQIDTFTNNYDLIERVTAGYLMNTLQFGRVRLQTGLRFEATNEDLSGTQVSDDPNTGNPFFTRLQKNSSYLDPLPSVQVRFGLGQNSAIRASYGRGIARPNYNDLPPIFDITGAPDVTVGNPNLKPTHSNNYDLLVEKYLQPLGVIQAGFFFKQLSDPIYEGLTQVITQQVAMQNPLLAPYLHGTVTEPINGQSAHLYGFEIAYQQHLSFLPGALSGIGVSANYGFTASSTVGVPFRTDLPDLQRQAPNTFNFSPTYDRGRLSARLGVSYNGPYIWSYAYSNLVADPNLSTGVSPNLVPLGKHGPFGDIYLYQHTQVDAQASYRVYHGLQFVVAGLNLTNAMFGFYAGSPVFPIQREYYKPSYEFGLRYTHTSEK